MLLFSVFKSKKYIKTGWNFVTLCKESVGYWSWSLLMLILIVVVLETVPESSELIKGLTGLDIGTKAASFVTLGIGLTGLSKG